MLEYRSEEDTHRDIEEILPLLDLLPQNEADMLELAYFHKKSQNEIALIWGCTQANVTYRLHRAVKRLKFLIKYPKLDVHKMHSDLLRCFNKHRKIRTLKPGSPLKTPISNERLVDVCVAMYISTCQSAVAKQMGLQQCAIRHHFMSAIRLLKKLIPTNPQLFLYHKAFMMIVETPTILHAVVHPQWEFVMAEKRNETNK